MPSATNIDAGFAPGTYPPAAGYFGYPAGVATREGQYPYGEYPPSPSDVFGYPPGTPAAPVGLQEPFNNFTANGWTLTNTPTIVAGRNGTAAKVTLGGTATYTIPSGVRSNLLTMGFAYKIDTLSGQSNILFLLGDGGATEHNRLQVQASGAVTFVRQPATILANSTTGLVAANTWCYLEVQVLLADAGAYKVRVNGTEVISGSGDTRNGGTVAVYDQIKLVDAQGFTSIIQLYDDLYVTTAAGAAFQGDHVVA